MPACEVVGNSEIVVMHVSYPIVGVYVVYTEQVECVNSQPHIAQKLSYAGAVDVILVVQQSIGHSNVYAGVCRGGKTLFLASCVRRAERQSVGIHALQAHLPALGTGEEGRQELAQNRVPSKKDELKHLQA